MLTLINKNHFAGGKNLTPGSETGGKNQDLASLIRAQQQAINTIDPNAGDDDNSYLWPKGGLLAEDVGKMLMWDGQPKVYALGAAAPGTKMYWEIEIAADPVVGTPAVMGNSWFGLSVNLSGGEQIQVNTPNWGGVFVAMDGGGIGATKEDTMQQFVAWADGGAVDNNEIKFTWNAGQSRIDCRLGDAYLGQEGGAQGFVAPQNENQPHGWFLPNMGPWAEMNNGVWGNPGDRVTVDANPFFNDFVEYGVGDWTVAPGDNDQIAENLKVALQNLGIQLVFVCNDAEWMMNATVTRVANVVKIEGDDFGESVNNMVMYENQGPPFNQVIGEDIGSCDVPPSADKKYIGKLIALGDTDATIVGENVFTAEAAEDMTGGTTYAAPIDGEKVRNRLTTDQTVFNVLNGTPLTGEKVILGIRD